MASEEIYTQIVILTTHRRIHFRKSFKTQI